MYLEYVGKHSVGHMFLDIDTTFKFTNTSIANYVGICKILHICEVEKDKWMLLVWDGTDTPPVTIKTK